MSVSFNFVFAGHRTFLRSTPSVGREPPFFGTRSTLSSDAGDCQKVAPSFQRNRVQADLQAGGAENRGYSPPRRAGARECLRERMEAECHNPRIAWNC